MPVSTYIQLRLEALKGQERGLFFLTLWGCKDLNAITIAVILELWTLNDELSTNESFLLISYLKVSKKGTL